MASPYLLPQVRVFEDYQLSPAAQDSPHWAHVSGGHAQLVRYAEADEKATGALGAYDALADRAYAWPGKAAGAIVDLDYARVYLDQARLEYFRDELGGGLTVAPVAGTADRVRISGSAGFVANGAAYPRLAALGDRDVRAGDRAWVRGVAGGTPYELDTYVRAVEAVPVPATIGAATHDAANGATSVASAAVTKVAGDSSCNTLAANLSDYDAWADGVLDETYTVLVTKGSAGGDLGTAELRVTSASGLDDDLVVVSGDIGVEFAVGRRGLRLAWSCSDPGATSSTSVADLVAGEAWTVAVQDDYRRPTLTAAGTYAGAADTTYIVEVTRGGLFAAAAAADRPQITCSTAHGVDASGPTTVAAAATAYPVGTRGVTIAFSGAGVDGLRKGDKYYIAVTADAPGAYRTLRLGHELPDEIRGAADLDLVLAVERDVELPRRRAGSEPDVNWSAAADAITLKAAAVVRQADFTADGAPVDLPVASARAYVQYRAWRRELVGVVGAVVDVGELDAAIPGALDPDNPLKYGVYKALANANGTEVKFTAVADPSDLDSWLDVLDAINGDDGVYGLAPMTADRAVHDAFAAHVAALSGPSGGLDRGAWVPLAVAERTPVVTAATTADGAVALAVLEDDPDTAGTRYARLRVPAGNARFLANGVRPGDTVRYLYSTSWGEESYAEFVVDAVLNEDALLLASGHSVAVGLPSKVEVWRTLSADELADAAAAAAASFGSARVKAVWPDTIESAGVALPGYYLCAALAGLRSGVLPHQPLTNVEIAGFDGVPRTTELFTATQLNRMAAAGVYIVTRTRTGAIVSRHAVTTSTVDVKHSEEMFVSALDTFKGVVRGRVAPFVGRTNVTPSALSLLRVEVESAIDYAKSFGYTPTLGGLLIGGEIVRLGVHPLRADGTEIVIAAQFPFANNLIDVHIQL